MYKKLIIRERDKYLFDIGRSWLNTDDSTNRGDLFDIRKSWGIFLLRKIGLPFYLL